MRITAQLVNVADGFHLWSESYDRTLDDIFAVQDDIARSVAEALEVTLLADSDRTGGRGGNPEAYNLYLQGQHFGKLLSPEDQQRAVKYFEEALALAPDYAPAWAGLAHARVNQAYMAQLPFEEAFRLAREAATRAIELDGELADGWAALGDISMSYDWDWARAEIALGKARALAPGNPGVLVSASFLSAALGRPDQASAFARRAVELDPLNATARSQLGFQLLRVGHLQEAEATFQKVLELQPERRGARWALGMVELARSRPEAAIAEMEQESAAVWRGCGLALAHHALGNRAQAEAVLRETTETYGEGWAFQLAEIHAFRGEPDAAFRWLERAYENRDPGLADTKASSLLVVLHDDPRWPEFLEKMGLPE